MSTLKRKDAPGGQPPAKSAKSDKEARPSKKDDASKGATSSKKPDSGNPRPKAGGLVSVLKDEEPMFPRGGGSILTPLEQKQIQLEAKADAQQEDEFETAPKAAKKKRKSQIKSDKKSGNKKQDEEKEVKPESLNFTVRHDEQPVCVPQN